MSSRNGGAKGGLPGSNGANHSAKGKGTGNPASSKASSVSQLSHDMADVNINSTEGGWEVFTKKSRNKGGATVANSWGSTQNASGSWGKPEISKTNSGATGMVGKPSGNNSAQPAENRKQAGRGSPKIQSSGNRWEAAYMTPVAPPPVIPPPLQHGWQWAAKNISSSSQQRSFEDGKNKNVAHETAPQEDLDGDDFVSNDNEQSADYSDDGAEDDDLEDSDDEFSEDYDSEASEKSHETKKKSSWYRAFFEALHKLTVEQINEPTRQWHCPACKGGPGAIDWYRGLQPLITHAKTKGSKRVRLHRNFAEILEEELYRRGASLTLDGEAFGKWKGLRETTTDREVVWPPMVIIMNTLLEQDENDKYIGMGNQELLEYFSAYAAVKARHSYGPHGHRGMSVLIFEPSAVGYMEAERLDKHFQEQGTDRDSWERRKVLFYPGGKRQLYGFLACKEDLDNFNQHSHGKTRLKFELRSYQEMVVSQMKQMSEDNQQLTWLKNKVAKQEQHKKTLEESFGIVSQKLRETMEENRIVRERTMTQHEQNKEEMDYQEQFFKEQMEKIHQATEEKEKLFERLLQEERIKAKKQSGVDSGTKEERRLRKEEMARFISTQVKEVEEFEAAREELIKAHEEKKVVMRQRHCAEEVELEKEFDAELTKLMEKYSPEPFQPSSRS